MINFMYSRVTEGESEREKQQRSYTCWFIPQMAEIFIGWSDQSQNPEASSM